ncbi:MAG: TlpA disulfide reductase family protein [Alphaproteobacteria bacterium]
MLSRKILMGAVAAIALVTIGALAAVYWTMGVGGNAGGDLAAVRLTAPTKGRLAAFIINKTPEALASSAFHADDGSAQGAQTKLADWRGRVVLVNLWATWCAPCRFEMPTLDNLQAKLGSKDFEVLAVSLDRSGLEKPRAFFAAMGLKNLKVYNNKSSSFSRALRAIGLPTTVLIDRQGRELGRMVGPAEWDSPDAVALIRSAINAAP